MSTPHHPRPRVIRYLVAGDTNALRRTIDDLQESRLARVESITGPAHAPERAVIWLTEDLAQRLARTPGLIIEADGPVWPSQEPQE